jgi:hypothetical protein
MRIRAKLSAQIPINALDQKFAGATNSFPQIAFQARSFFFRDCYLVIPVRFLIWSLFTKAQQRLILIRLH